MSAAPSSAVSSRDNGSPLPTTPTSTDAVLQKLLQKMEADSSLNQQLQHAQNEIAALREGQAKLTAVVAELKLEVAVLKCQQSAAVSLTNCTHTMFNVGGNSQQKDCNNVHHHHAGTHSDPETPSVSLPPATGNHPGNPVTMDDDIPAALRTASGGGASPEGGQHQKTAPRRNVPNAEVIVRKMPAFLSWADAWFPCRSLKDSPQGSDDYFLEGYFARCLVELCSHYPWIVSLGVSMWKRLLIRMYVRAKPETHLLPSPFSLGDVETEDATNYRYGANGNLCHLLHILPRVGIARRASHALFELRSYEDGTSTDRTRDTVKKSLYHFKEGAVTNNQQDVVLLMIQELGVSNAGDPVTMVRVALDFAHLALVRTLVQLGHDIGHLEEMDLEVSTDLRGQKALALQLELGADPNVFDSGRGRAGWTPLHEAVEQDELRALEIILGMKQEEEGEHQRHHDERGERGQKSLDLELVDAETNSTPLQLAIKLNRIEHVKRLLEHGAMLKQEDKGTDPEIDKLLREHRGGSGGGESNNNSKGGSSRGFWRKNRKK